jgi:hypothetical protein
MEAAVLSAGLRGEFDDDKSAQLAKQFVVTPSIVRQAYKSLLLNTEGAISLVRFNGAYLTEGQNPTAQLRFDNWALRAAAVYNQPLPVSGFTHGSARISTIGDVGFHGLTGEVRFRTSLNETDISFGSWDRLVRDFDNCFTMTKTSMPRPRKAPSIAFSVLAEYQRETPRGAIALSPAGPSSKPAVARFGLVTEGVAWRGLVDSLEMALRDFGLPRHLATAGEVSHHTVLIANIEGSFRFQFNTEVNFRFLRSPQGDGEQWTSVRTNQSLPASGVLTASGAFQLSLARGPNNFFRFSIHRAARSPNSPIYLATFGVAGSQWLSWLHRAADEIKVSSDQISSTLREMAVEVESMVKERAYYHSSRQGTDPDESWYRAEEIETEPVGDSLARILGNRYSSQLRSQIERDVSGRPFLEIEVQDSQGMEFLLQAIRGHFDLKDRTNHVRFSGSLVSAVDTPQHYDAILAPGKPTALVDESDRIVLFDPRLQTGVVALAHVDASVAGKSGPPELSAPSTTLASPFFGASSDLLRVSLAGIVERWIPHERENWENLLSRIGEQAGTDQWNAIVRLKLHWAIDLRTAGREFEPERDSIVAEVRRELRLLLPFYYFTRVADFMQLKTAIPLLVYRVLPKDVSSSEDLALNTDVLGGVFNILRELKPALQGMGIPMLTQLWNVPHWLETASSWTLQQILAWETYLAEVMFRGLSQSYRFPNGRAGALESMANQIVEALSVFPLFADNPRATTALRTVLFTTGLSLMASSPANVTAELSLTAFDRATSLAPAWIAAPDSVPLESIIGYGRITAMTESAAPMRRQRAVAASR